jgi:toxoflavin biosynthesis protein ToxC
VRVADWQILPPVERAHDEIVNGAAVLADGRFVSVSRDLSMRIWQGAESTRFPTPHKHSVRAVAACPQSDILATGAYDGTVCLFDARQGRWLKVERPSDFGISSICAGDGSGVFLASSYDGCVYEISASSAPKVRVSPLAA